MEFIKERDNYPEFCIPIAVAPATISNNVPGTDFSLGCDTALNGIVEVRIHCKDYINYWCNDRIHFSVKKNMHYSVFRSVIKFVSLPKVLKEGCLLLKLWEVSVDIWQL